MNTSCGWFNLAANSSSGGWIQVTANSILRLTRVPAARHELRLIPSHGRVELRWLDTGSGWLCSTADLSSGGRVRVTADSILQLTQVRVAGYDLRLIPYCDWLEFRQLASVLYCNISSKFKDLFCKIQHFFGLLSTAFYYLLHVPVDRRRNFDILSKHQNNKVSFTCQLG